MKAVRFDIDIYEGSRFQETFTWRDANGNPIDLSNYGARIAVGLGNGKSPVITGSHSSEITLGSDGTIAIDLPSADTSKPLPKVSKWQLEVFDDSTATETDVDHLIRGLARYHRKLD